VVGEVNGGLVVLVVAFIVLNVLGFLGLDGHPQHSGVMHPLHALNPEALRDGDAADPNRLELHELLLDGFPSLVADDLHGNSPPLTSPSTGSYFASRVRRSRISAVDVFTSSLFMR
jgi:hypothetical protein